MNGYIHFGIFFYQKQAQGLVRDSTAVWRLLWTCCSRGTSESYAYGKQRSCLTNSGPAHFHVLWLSDFIFYPKPLYKSLHQSFCYSARVQTDFAGSVCRQCRFVNSSLSGQHIRGFSLAFIMCTIPENTRDTVGILILMLTMHGHVI
jgi:hypothetical protein